MILTPSFTGINSTRSPLASMLLIASMVFSSIFQLLFDDLAVLPGVVGHGGLEERLRFVAARPMPISFCVLINPWGIPAALGVNAGAKLLIRSIRAVRADVNGRFFRVYLVRNAVAKVASIDRRQLFGVSLRHKTAFFQRLFHGGMKGAENGAGVIGKCNAHCCNALSPRFWRSHCANVISGISPLRSRRKASSCGISTTDAIRLHRQLYTR